MSNIRHRTVPCLLYDENGSAYGFLLKNGSTENLFYYVFNAQGDVIGIVNESGAQIVSYDYSVWGEVLSVTGTGANTIGQKNPIRYRGYYYDNETGFYYLQSRYYDPKTGRFLNADGQLTAGSDILGCNLFAYCGNNPVNRNDPTGHLWQSVQKWCKAAIKSVKKAVSKVAKSIKSFAQKTCENKIKILKTFISSFELTIDSGFGLAGNAEVGNVGIDVGVKMKMPEITIGKETTVKEIGEVKFNVDLFVLEMGYESVESLDSATTHMSEIYLRPKSSITIADLGIWVLYGAGVSLDFKLDDFIAEVKVFYE